MKKTNKTTIRKQLSQNLIPIIKDIQETEKTLLGSMNRILKLSNSTKGFNIDPIMRQVIKSNNSLDYIRPFLTWQQKEKLDRVEFEAIQISLNGQKVSTLRYVEDSEQMKAKYEEKISEHMFKLETFTGIELDRDEFAKRYETEDVTVQRSNRFNLVETLNILIKLTAEFKVNRETGMKNTLENLETVLKNVA